MFDICLSPSQYLAQDNIFEVSLKYMLGLESFFTAQQLCVLTIKQEW